ncbi:MULTISPECIES: toxin-antitoxin system [Mycobacteroides]|uniref:toxin-antitoxin system n=1 Tax=Mycobacteroides TaxID=670516 RepID=UPI000AA3CAC3|nr:MULTISPECIES: toxin-antitoxin system [Mycobacteroides]
MVGRPHKGDRVLLQSRPAREVWYAVRIAASEAGVSVSQYVADLLAQHVGRPDLVRGQDKPRPYDCR